MHGKGLTDGERANVTGLRRQLAKWLEPKLTLEDVEDLVMTVLMTMRTPNAGGQARHVVNGYLVALHDLPRNALTATVLEILRDEAGASDVRWAPTPPELRRKAKQTADLVAREIAMCDQLLAMVEAPAMATARAAAIAGRHAPPPPPASEDPPRRDTAYAHRVAEDLARRRADREAAAPAEPTPAAPGEPATPGEGVAA